jgi:2-isopropylmalate synthase
MQQNISVGPMSGKSNVIWVLEHNGLEATQERIDKVLDAAKSSPRQLTTSEVVAAANG